MRWLLLAVVVLSGCECGTQSGTDAATDASVERDAGEDAGPALDGAVTVSFDGSFGDVLLGSFVGAIRRANKTWLSVKLEAPVARGDGVLIEGGWGSEAELGGRVWSIAQGGRDVESAAGGDVELWLGPDVKVGALAAARVFKTNDPALEKRIAASLRGERRVALDMRIAGDNAQFGVTSAKIGSVAGLGGTQRLPRLVGAGRAKELLFTADFIDAREADRIGLVNKVVPVPDVLTEAKRLVARCAERAPLSIWLMKRAVDIGMNCDLQSALYFEQHCTALTFATADRQDPHAVPSCSTWSSSSAKACINAAGGAPAWSF